MKLHRRRDTDHLVDPLHDQAWRRLRIGSDEMPAATFIDRLTDLARRASAAASDG
ncbi:hypothetical protein C8D87_10116 [Lentzea atacamensis]|uniref:Uncharacterized protein n=1 Tax=Lentzea atacamensis TaxID=531938 RepID=A0ABX9EJ38_9PSEU|nr:hypothetical protein [Lentzea atacamensis]RAS69717.1 hypothetical protein C8D87_10116 [Lentzea atacamensis]